MQLTKRDAEILEYIKNYMLENGIAPTIREIGVGIHLTSTATIQRHMERLEVMGYLERPSANSYRYTVKGIKYTEVKES